MRHDEDHGCIHEFFNDADETHNTLAKSLTAPPTRSPAPKQPRPLVENEDNTLLTLHGVGGALGAPDIELGVDYIEVRFRIKRMRPDPELDWQGRSSDTSGAVNGRWSVWIPLVMDSWTTRLRMAVTIRGTDRLCTVGFNPSSVLYGPGTQHCATHSQVKDLVGHIFDVVVPQQVVPLDPVSMALITRLDVAAHVERVASPEALYEYLVRHPARPRRKYQRFYKGGRGTGVYVKPNDESGFRVYAKGPHSRTSGSVIRFEVEARKELCRDVCPTIDHLSPVALSRIFARHCQPIGESLSEAPRSLLEGFVADDRYQRTISSYLGEQVLKREGLGHCERSASHVRRTLRRLGVFDALDRLIEERWN
jgi:hypothetical protein